MKGRGECACIFQHLQARDTEVSKGQRIWAERPAADGGCDDGCGGGGSRGRRSEIQRIPFFLPSQLLLLMPLLQAASAFEVRG